MERQWVHVETKEDQKNSPGEGIEFVFLPGVSGRHRKINTDFAGAVWGGLVGKGLKHFSPPPLLLPKTSQNPWWKAKLTIKLIIIDEIDNNN